jgi:hypothetical protein
VTRDRARPLVDTPPIRHILRTLDPCIKASAMGILPTAERTQGGTRMPNPSIKNEKLYEDLREEGNSKQKSARIANAAAARGTSAVGRKGGRSGSYDDWTVSELKKRAKEIGISGYSALTKSKLIDKIRNS